MSKRLCNLKLEEFSLVRGDDLQPANPESTAAFYKAQPKAKESSMAEKTQNAPAETPAKTSLAKQIAAAVRGAIQKATVTRTSTSDSTSHSVWTDTCEEPDPAAAGTAAEPGEGGTTIVITDAVEKTVAPAAPAPIAKTEPAAGVADLTEALAPIAKAVTALDSRLAKIEKTPVGSRVLKANGITQGAQVFDNSEQKFPDFTKFLAAKAGLSAGQKLTKATLSSAGWTYGLSYVEAGNFIDYIIDQSVLLKLCRTIKMPDKKYPVDKLGLGGSVLVKGTPGVDPGDTVSTSGPTQVLLDAQEVLAIVSIGDDTLEDNIEGEAFVQHLLGMVARSAANELEQAAIHGDTGTADTGILDRFDGWYKQAKAAGAHVVEAMTDTDRYWPGDSATKATKVIKAIPTKYRMDVRNLACILAPDAYLDYNDMLAEKAYTDAWASITGIRDLPVRGIKNVQVPMLKTNMAFTYSATPYTDGTCVMICDLRNLLFGVHREIKIEPFRQPRKRCTDYVLSMRCDAKIENGDAIGIYDHAKVK
jgi:hypothetical protein